MIEPRAFLAAEPEARGVLAAMFYFPSGDDVGGWLAGAQGQGFAARFFWLEDFYRGEGTRTYLSAGDDVQGEWLAVSVEHGRAVARSIDPPLPVSEEAARELDRIQDFFAREWLFFAEDPDAAAEVSAYGLLGFPVRALNIRAKRLGRLRPADGARIERTLDFDLQVIDYLQQRWPLDYRRG
ncbi:MAG: hypothetical protein MUF79_09090 [Burkholderiales bacterium]|jgi:hypothetical protein|nr:hypothetical protein [Burkholderiales bacterium]